MTKRDYAGLHEMVLRAKTYDFINELAGEFLEDKDYYVVNEDIKFNAYTRNGIEF